MIKEVKTVTLEELYDKRDNAFDVIRFLLAVAVIYSHSHVLLLGPGKSADFLEIFTRYQTSLGSFAVNAFFVISGFLIMQSLANSSSYFNYFKNRFLRIFPAFFVSLVVIAFVIGPFITNVSYLDYFSPNATSPYLFVFKNITFNIFGYVWTVRDLFEHSPFQGSVNGSMWTLKHEFALYILLPILSYFLFIKHKLLILFLSIILVFLSILNILYGYKLVNLEGIMYWVFSNNEYNNIIKLAPYFLIGSLMYLFREKIIIDNRLIVLTLILLIMSIKMSLLNIIMIFTLPYLIIALAIKLKYSRFRKYGDFSYGLYIYAFPIQQLLVHFLKSSLNISGFFIISTLITLVVSVISWHLIEKRVLAFKVGIRGVFYDSKKNSLKTH